MAPCSQSGENGLGPIEQLSDCKLALYHYNYDQPDCVGSLLRLAACRFSQIMDIILV